MFDAVGRQTVAIDARGNAAYYGYDTGGYPVSATDGLGQTEYFAYDANGNLMLSQDPDGETTYFTYSPVRMLTVVAYPDGERSEFTYDAASNVAAMTGMTAPRGWTYFSYDAANRVTGEKPTWESVNDVTHEYDPAGRRIRLGSPCRRSAVRRNTAQRR